MADFDFDELDKAVSETQSDSNGADTGDDSSLPQSPAMHRASAGASEYLGQNRPHFEAAPAARQAPSGGRFMDIVHPSSDMRSHSTSKSRFHPPAATYSHVPEVPNTDTEEEPLPSPSGQKPLESPFLPDAKVEKRPLGGVGPADGNFAAPSLQEEPLLDAPDEPRLEAPDEPLLDEGTHDEEARNDDGSDSGNNDNDTTSAATEAQDSETTPQSQSQSQPQPQSPAATSISQQYKEQPSTPPQQPGALYATEAYHQPLPHAEKKHSGVWTLFWIILLVLIGAGIGAAAYFFVVPLL